MNMLTRKNMKWQQRKEQQKAFNKLKGIFTTRPVLAAPDLDKEFKVEADASNYTTGEVLLIECSNELQRPVAFISKSLSNIERNYKIFDKEMLTVVKCLEVQRYFLERMTINFEIWTDYKNLKYFIKVQKLNRRQARQILYLSRFNLTLKYVLESKMEKVNSLNRRPDWEIEVKRDNEDEILVKLVQLEMRKTEKVKVIVERVDLLEKVKQSKVKDNEVVRAVEEMK